MSGKSFCSCTRDGERISLCQLHAIEFEKRHAERLKGTDIDLACKRVREAILDSVEQALVGGRVAAHWSPMDQWIRQNIEQLRRA